MRPLKTSWSITPRNQPENILAADIVRCIEFWYNLKRRHSGLQYRSPRQVRDEYLETQLTA